jgi:hypothetical protein
MRSRQLVALITLSALLLASCTTDTPEPTSTRTSIGPTQAPPPYVTPFPTAVPGSTPAPNITPTPPPTVSEVPSTTTVATSVEPGWTKYISINDIYDLEFAADGSLWALTRGGLVHWDLNTGTYTRYLIQPIDIAVAPDGTLWLAMEAGLCHFGAGLDGSATCRNYTAADGLIDNTVRVVTVDADGTVWVGTQIGLSRFDGDSWKSYPSPVPTEDLAVAPNGEVWHATPIGISRYSPSQDAWTTYSEENGLPHSHGSIVAVGPNGEVWTYILWQGIYRLNDSASSVSTTRTGDGESWEVVEEVPGGLVGEITFAADGTPWVGTVGSTHYPGGSLAYYDGDKWVEVTAGYGLMSIRAVAAGPEGMVAASTHLGLGIYQDGEWRHLRDGPSSDRVTSIAITPNGTAWFAFGDQSAATAGGGVSRYDGQTWQYDLDDAEVNTLALAPDGSLWAGTTTGLRRFDGHTWQVVTECENAVDCGVLDIAFAADGDVWIADGFSVSQYPDPALSARASRTSAGDTDDGQSRTRYEKLVHSLVSAPDGSIWMNGWEGTQGSAYVARVKDGAWTTFKVSESFPGSFTVGAATDDGCVWGVVRAGGLACFAARGDSADKSAAWEEGESWTLYPSPDGVLLYAIIGVAPDGALWLSTEDGVARFDPAADPTGDTESASSNAWTLYTKGDGLGSAYHAIAFGPYGEIWFGTTRFQPEQAGALPPSSTHQEIAEPGTGEIGTGLTASPTPQEAPTVPSHTPPTTLLGNATLFPSTPTPTPYTGPTPTFPPTPTPEIDPACKAEWDRASFEMAQVWERVIADVDIEGLYSSSASVMGECIRNETGTVAFQPTQTWFYVSTSIPKPDVDQVGDSFAAYLDVLFANFAADDLPGSDGIIYGTLSVAYTDDSGWPMGWEYFLWLPFEEAAAAHSQGLSGRTLLEALGIVTPAE